MLIDPISPPDELVAGRELRVALTCPWHVRDAPELGAPETDELETRPGFYPDERVLWLPEHGALVFGDSFPGGPVPDQWLPEDNTESSTASGSHRSWSCRWSSSCRPTATPAAATSSNGRFPSGAARSRRHRRAVDLQLQSGSFARVVPP